MRPTPLRTPSATSFVFARAARRGVSSGVVPAAMIALLAGTPLFADEIVDIEHATGVLNPAFDPLVERYSIVPAPSAAPRITVTTRDGSPVEIGGRRHPSGEAVELKDMAPGTRLSLSTLPGDLDGTNANETNADAAPASDGPLGGFCGQHLPTRLDGGHLLLFDNGQNCWPPNAARGERTRVLEYRLDTETMEAHLVWSHERDDAYSERQGSAQRLANGNTLIGWGYGPDVLVSEVNRDGRTVFELVAEGNDDTPVHGYRAYRFDDRTAGR